MTKDHEHVSIKKIATFVIARGLPAAVNFLAMSFYAHSLAPAAYGEYSLCLFASSLLSALLFSWLNSALLRFFEENKNTQSILLNTLSKSFFIVSLIIIVASIPIYFWLRETLIYIIMLTISQSFLQLCLGLLAMQVRALGYAFFSSLNAILTLMLAFIFIKFGWGVLGIIVAMTLSNFLSVARIFLGDWQFSLMSTFDISLLKKCLFYGFPLSISMIVGVLIYGVDRLLLTHFCDKTSLGLYALPYDLANQSITLLFMAFQIYLYPLVLRNLSSGGKESANRCLQENGRIFLIIILPCMLFLINFSSWIGQIVTGPQFQAAFSEILPLIAVTAVLAGLKAYYFDLAFQLSRKTLIQLYISGAVLLVNILLNLFIIPKYSYLGAAYVSIFSASLGIALSWFWGRFVFKMPPLITFKNSKIFALLVLVGFLFNQTSKLSNWFLVILFSMFIVGVYALLVMFLYKIKPGFSGKKCLTVNKGEA